MMVNLIGCSIQFNSIRMMVNLIGCLIQFNRMVVKLVGCLIQFNRTMVNLMGRGFLSVSCNQNNFKKRKFMTKYFIFENWVQKNDGKLLW